MQRIHIITDEQDADRFLRDLVEQAQWHETHKPEPAPWKGKALGGMLAEAHKELMRNPEYRIREGMRNLNRQEGK
jgi:hypothetical protein